MLSLSKPIFSRAASAFACRTRAIALSGKALPVYCTRRHASARPAYEGHTPLNWFENAFLAVGSGIVLLTDPARADMVAALGETTAGPSLPCLREHMLESAEGRRILKARPRINTRTVDMASLAALPENTLGRTYVSWLERCNVTPDSREPVHYIDDPELAYVMQRYRECHDLYHAAIGLPVDGLSELAVKAFEFANLGLPMAALSATLGPLRLSSARKERYFKEYLPWALRCGGSARSMITVYWEERWTQDIGELRRELGLTEPPPTVWKKPRKPLDSQTQPHTGEIPVQ
ncbi:ubiquinone biosynthesis protein COQ4, mitochondrial [Fomitiporia mediterranea MF3/22]|uniref:ubiquinone biosynthesis protein COQ4, mitochondrial n=1 Tax=Fomitiporia mediterranea (strain MF3/22) TaxID=694068 RepID=UPI000440861F|nr:ubiquinone biosynthesis protein COQ4, mitochondrial [Fomitiporia mediterranea MF3/22]EJD07098.1 ubiquinone biosynthesis protein COQ4, mitochondrial [Fomitiporia mediterranea MF3/22]